MHHVWNKPQILDCVSNNFVKLLLACVECIQLSMKLMELECVMLSFASALTKEMYFCNADYNI